MKLREGEKVIKVYHHHPTPFVFDVIKVILGAFPFFFMLYLFQSLLSGKWFALLHLIIFFVFALIIVYISLIYWLDKFVITNHRVIYTDWKYLGVREEADALLNDIKDIQTEEKGFLASFRIFDYGMLRLDTPSSYVTIEFYDAPDPESIRLEIYKAKEQ